VKMNGKVSTDEMLMCENEWQSFNR